VEQKAALEAVVKTLKTEHLMIPKSQLKLFPPRAFGYSRTRESFKSDMGVSFDALGAAATSSNMTLSLLLHPQRANRLVQQNAMDPKNIGFIDVLNSVLVNVYNQPAASAYEKEVSRTIQYVTLHQLLELVANKNASPQVKAIINDKLDSFKKMIDVKSSFGKEMLRDIKKFREDPDEFKRTSPPEIPDGSPIGMDCSGPNYNQ
jgi:hypothetical protein